MCGFSKLENVRARNNLGNEAKRENVARGSLFSILRNFCVCFDLREITVNVVLRIKALSSFVPAGQ